MLLIMGTRSVRAQETSRCLCAAAGTQSWHCCLGLARVVKFLCLYTHYQSPLLHTLRTQCRLSIFNTMFSSRNNPQAKGRELEYV